MLIQNKTDRNICLTELQTTPRNTVVIQNVVDIKQNKTSGDWDATVKSWNKIDNLQSKLKHITTKNIIKEQKKKKLEQRLHNIVADTVTTRTQDRSKRWVIADAGATRYFMIQGAQVINVKPTNNTIKITLPTVKQLCPRTRAT
jgi:hypothetical protein